MQTKKYGVFYTDGGFILASKLGGYGLHGYLYDTQIPKTGTGLKDWYVTPCGYYSKFTESETGTLTVEERYELWKDHLELAANPTVTNVHVLNYIDEICGLENTKSSDTPEITAVVEAFQKAVDYDLESTIIYTDSQYVQLGYTDLLNKWIADGWKNSKGKDIANLEKWQKLIELKATILAAGRQVKIVWVKGHNGDYGNTIADLHATKGIALAESGILSPQIKVSSPQGYWKVKVELNKFFTHSNWYFNTNLDVEIQAADGRYVYHTGHHGKDDDFLGKRMSDASFAILHLGEPEEVLEQIRSKQQNADAQQLNSFMIGKLDYIFRPNVYKELMGIGASYLKQRGPKLDLYTLDDQQLTKELRPPRLAYSLVDIMGSLEERLHYALSENPPPTQALTDITELLYTKETKKGNTLFKLKPEWSSAVKSLTVFVNQPLAKDPNPCSISLTLGMDLPDRNTLAAIATRNPRVLVVTWAESAQAFRFATVIEAGADTGIFAGFYSNIHLML
jgi:ribonuclease HI